VLKTLEQRSKIPNFASQNNKSDENIVDSNHDVRSRFNPCPRSMDDAAMHAIRCGA
jgi:hypothetical protein